jgi:hypothetical protein
MLAGDEGRPAGGTRLLRVVIGEERALSGDTINVRRSSTHHAAVIGADVPDADVIGHDDQNIGFLLFWFCHFILLSVLSFFQPSC